jgi:serine protease
MRTMRSVLSWACVILCLTSCQKEQVNPTSAGNGLSSELKLNSSNRTITISEPLNKSRLDELVIASLEQNGDFRWDDAPLDWTWSALFEGEQALAIGYQPAGMTQLENQLHKINLRTGIWKETHDVLLHEILSILSEENRQSALRLSDIMIEDDPILPILTIRTNSKKLVERLAQLQNVRYLEPLDYWPGTEAERSTSGCGVSSTSLNSSDYSSLAPNCLLPWNFNNIQVPGAWALASGQNITIGVIDAGLSSSQPLLGSDFNNGESNSGRVVTTDYTFGSSAYTSCSHGTSMAGTAVGPKNNSGASTGIAFKSNLHFIRGCEDVVLDKSSERTGVKNALIKMGNKADVRIVSMSVGTPFYSSVLYDGVVYANNMGKLLLAAAGTSFSWTSWWGVVYPAAHSQCVAVTGVKENYNTCSSCHDGSQVDLTVVMERSSNSNRNSLSLRPSGVTPSYIGGSSVATASVAGVAGLIWSLNPNFTKDEVYNFLKTTSQYYPGTSSNTGYGNINAQAAVAAAQASL